MYARHGETPGSNRGRVAKTVGAMLRRLPMLSLIIRNPNARHRMPNKWVPLEYRLAYLQNRWYAEYRPKYRRVMQLLKLRK
jgi:hypothetical protein